MREKHLFTSESVSEGHPDKIADQISDAILDALLAKDPDARVACETSVTTGLVFVFVKFRPLPMWIFKKSFETQLSELAIPMVVMALTVIHVLSLWPWMVNRRICPWR